jgi:hypothetical protein
LGKNGEVETRAQQAAWADCGHYCPTFHFHKKNNGLPALAESHTISNFIEFRENITVFMIYYVENIFQPKFNDTNFVA